MCMHVQVSIKARGIGSSGAIVTATVSHPTWMPELISGPLQEQYYFLTGSLTEPEPH